MSLYQFFASNCELKEYDNMPVRKIKNNSQSNIMVVAPRGEEDVIRIHTEKSRYLTDVYTPKKFCSYIEWYYNRKNAKVILDYIKEHLMYSKSIQLWNTWMGDVSEAEYKRVNICDLTIREIKDIWGQESFSHTQCLTVYIKQ